jgi:hypothetical protein
MFSPTDSSDSSSWDCSPVRTRERPAGARYNEVPAYPVAWLFGDAAKPLPVWAELASAERWHDVKAPLG